MKNVDLLSVSALTKIANVTRSDEKRSESIKAIIDRFRLIIFEMGVDSRREAELQKKKERVQMSKLAKRASLCE